MCLFCVSFTNFVVLKDVKEPEEASSEQAVGTSLTASEMDGVPSRDLENSSEDEERLTVEGVKTRKRRRDEVEELKIGSSQFSQTKHTSSDLDLVDVDWKGPVTRKRKRIMEKTSE